MEEPGATARQLLFTLVTRLVALGRRPIPQSGIFSVVVVVVDVFTGWPTRLSWSLLNVKNVRVVPTSGLRSGLLARPQRPLYCHVLEVVCHSPGSARATVVFPVDGVKSQIKAEEEEEEETAATSAVAPSVKQSAWPVCVLCTVSRCCQSGGT